DLWIRPLAPFSLFPAPYSPYVSDLRPGGPRPLDVPEGVAQLTEPLVGVLADETNAPGQRVAAAPRHTRVDHRVAHSPPGLPRPRHHRHGQRGEHDDGSAALDAPGDLAAEAMLGLTRDVDTLLARTVAESLHISGDHPGTLRVGGALGDVGLGQR